MPDTAAATVAAPALPPAADVDIAAVRSAAAGMLPLGRPVADHGERAVRAWRRVGSLYYAPETPVLLAALDPLLPLTQTAASRMRGLGAVLQTWADAAEPIITELRRLAAGGQVTPEQAARMTTLIEHLGAVEQACAAAIRRLGEASLAPAKIKVEEHVEKGDAGITAGILTLDGGAAFKVATFSDGSVAVTAVDTTKVGLAGTAAGLIDLGGGVKIESGSTWKFQDSAEAALMLDQLRRYVQQRRRPTPAGKGSFPAGALVRPPRPPDSISSEAGVTGSAGASIERGIAKAGVTLDGSVKEVVTHDQTNGTTTSSFGGEGSVAFDRSLSPDLGPGSATAAVSEKDGYGATREVTRDPTGRITRVQLTETSSGMDSGAGGVKGPRNAPGGSGVHPSGGLSAEHKDTTVTVTTTTLDVNDGNRQVVEDWVARGRPEASYAKLHNPDTAVPGDAFQNALYHEGKANEVTYEDVTDKQGIDAKVKGAGPTVGGKYSTEDTTSRAVEASHLGAPGPDGVRRRVHDPVH